MGLLRRTVVLGAGAMLMAPAAFAKGRYELKGEGSVEIPSPWRVKTDYPNYANRADPALIAYRKWRSTMSGHPDCDGMIAIGRPDDFSELRGFVMRSRAALSIQWGAADTIPGQPWDGNEKRYPLVESAAASGEAEITQQLAVNRVGFFGVNHKAAHMYARDDRRGVMVAVWLFDSDGGLKGAVRLVDRIAASWRAS